MVKVEYEVSCTRCVVQYTNSRGEQIEVDGRGGDWRRQERISGSLGHVVLSAFPDGEGEKVKAARVYVEGVLRAYDEIPPGGTTEAVSVTADLGS